MVTDIEVAGIALAMFPIVVNGFSRFAEGVEILKSWRRYRRELAAYARTLECQQTWYLDTIEELLDGIIQSEEELTALTHDPGGDVWQQPKYEQKLRGRLDRSYEPYIATMSSMLEALDSLRKKLGVPSSGQIVWDDFSIAEREIKRIKVVLSKSVYTELLAQIDRANKQLRDITHQNRYLESVRHKRHSQRYGLDFKLVRWHAKSLYTVIVTGRSWRCRCREDHVANLRLELRPLEPVGDNILGNSTLKFKVFLSKSKSQSELGTLWTWHELEVQPLEDIPLQHHTLKHSYGQDWRNALSPQHLTAVPAWTKKTVKSAVVDSIELIDSTLFSPAMLSFSRDGGLSPIIDFCTALKQNCSVPKVIGYLLDEGAEYHRHDVCLVNDNHISTGSKTLETLLKLSQKRVSGYYLSRKDRLYLAVVLASSVLQLDGTSWLKKQWRSHDIFFLQMDDFFPNTQKVDYAYPYLSTKISPESLEPPPTTEVPAAYTAHLIRCEVLFALGLTLIELCFGETLLEMQIPGDVDSVEVLTSYRTANRLLDYVYDESGNRYGDVVRRCIQCPFDVRDASFDNEEFQQAVFESIVTPLMQDLKDFNGGSRIK